MSVKKKKKSGTRRDEEGTKIYARVRGLMPWEPRKVSLSVDGATRVRNKSGKVVNEYDFCKVFKPDSTNEQVFKVIVMPMISNVLKGFNAVLIAYGQTGSGKTFSMLGKPRLGVVGLLPRMLSYMVNQSSVSKVELTAVEAFGHHVAKIGLYDLFDPHNQVKSWEEKRSKSTMDVMEANCVEIHDADDAHDKIVFAHAASHFAPTGKNPESSRGHVTFVAKVYKRKSEHESQVSYFAFLDCAGSEGESAFTDAFKSRVDSQTLMARRLEAGTINTGLSQLQIIFNQLRIKGCLTKTVGNGLRRVLHPYINTNTYLSVLFTLSPSVNNAKPTESTLKFAVAAGMVKVKPVAAKGKVNFETLVAELKAHIERQEMVIEAQSDDIEDTERQMARLREAISRAKRGLPPRKKKRRKRGAAAAGGRAGIGDLTVSVKHAGEVYAPTGLTPPGFVSTPRAEAALPDEAAQAALLDVLDDSILDLMAELDEEFREQLEAEGLGRTSARDGGMASAGSSGAEAEAKSDGAFLGIPTGRVRGGRGRAVTTDEMNEAMRAALKSQQIWTASMTFEKRTEFALKRKRAREEQVERELAEQKKLYDQLKAVQQELQAPAKLDAMAEEKLSEHAMELTVLLSQQEALTRGLADSKSTIVEYLEGEGREALIKFFRMRGLL